MKKILLALLLSLVGLYFALGRSKTNSVEAMTDEELKTKIDSLVSIEQPLTATPLIAEAKKRAQSRKDTKWMLSLIDSGIKVNARRMSRESDNEKEYIKALDGAWTPLRQLICLRVGQSTWDQEKKKEYFLKAMEEPSALRKIKASDVADGDEETAKKACDDLNLLDRMGITIVWNWRDGYGLPRQTPSASLSMAEFAASSEELHFADEVIRTMMRAAIEAKDDNSLAIAQALRVSRSMVCNDSAHTRLMGDLMALKPTSNFAKAMVDVAKAMDMVDCAANRLFGDIEAANAKVVEAIGIYEDVIEKNPNSIVANLAQEEIKRLRQENFALLVPDAVVPGDGLPVSVSYRNLQKVSLRVYRTGNQPKEFKNDYQIARSSTLVTEKEVELPATKSMLGVTNAFTVLDGLKAGYYAIAAYKDSTLLDIQTFVCTTIAPAIISTGGAPFMLISDNKTGMPATDSKVNGSKSTDKNGWMAAPEGKKKMTIERGDDMLVYNDIHLSRGNYSRDKDERVNILTDRAIYRPGQKVFFKAYFYDRTRDAVAPLSTRGKCTIRLMGANYKELDRQELDIDEFGTAHGEFTIPTDAMRGSCHISAKYGSYTGSQFFSIEDYKRSNNTITFDTFDDVTLPGTNVVVSGKCKSAAGLPVVGATVKLTISNGEAKENKEVQTTTSLDGSFATTIEATSGWQHIEARITDSKGETCEGGCDLNSSAEGFNIGLSMKSDQSEVGHGPTFTITSANDNNRPYKSKVRLTVTRYAPLDRLRPVIESVPDTVIDGGKDYVFGQTQFASNNPQLEATAVYDKEIEVCKEKDIDLTELGLEAGRYLISISATALNNATLSKKADYIALAKEGKMEGLSYLHLNVPEQATAGDTFNIKVATGLANARVMVIAQENDVITMRKHIDVSHGVANIAYTSSTKTTDGSSVKFCAYVHQDGRDYKVAKETTIRKEEKGVKLSLGTFRDFSRPGAKETWTLKCEGDGPTTIAASMYDTRLDKYRNGEWNTRFSKLASYNGLWLSNPNPYLGLWHNRWGFGQGEYMRNDLIMEITEQCALGAPNEEAMANNEVFCMVESAQPMAGKAFGARAMKSVAYSRAYFGSAAMADEAEADLVEAEEEEDAAREDDEQDLPRENFAETVFFVPDLRPDANGNATIEFQLPDNLTKYRFQALAIDKKLHCAKVQQTLTVNKPLNASMGTPRFLTEGDSVTIAVSVTALDSLITGAEVSFTARDKETGRDITTFEPLVIDFNGTGAGRAAFSLVTPEMVEEMAFEVCAKALSQGGATGDTDGEKVVIPVSKRNIEVAESHSFALTDKGEHTIDNPFGDGRSKCLTFAYTSNAFIEVVRALPHLDKLWTPSTDTYLGRYESAAIATMLQQKPDIQKAVKYLKENGDKLRTIADAEHTPWYETALRLAKHDKEVVGLLSGDYARSTRRDNLARLERMQLSDGRFPWFSGMDGSDWQTITVATTLAEMMRLGLVDSEDMGTVSKILSKAQKPINKIISEELKNYKEAEKMAKESSTRKSGHHHFISSTTLDALHAHALTNKSLSADAKKLVDILKENWQYPSMCDRVTVTTILTYAGEKAAAKTIVKSLEENLVQTKDGTAYIPEDGLFHRRSQIMAQAMLIVALQRIAPESANLQRVINHLVLMKRGEAWPDAQSTSRAVLALLGSSASMAETDVVSVGEIRETCTVERPEVTVALPTDGSVKKATVVKSGKTTSWGSWQRIAKTPIDDMKADGTDKLSVERIVEVARFADGQTQWQTLGEGDALSVGDQIRVTLRLHNDEPLSFVRVRDYRTAAVEPDDKISGYRGWWLWRIADADFPTPCHYLAITDATTEFYIDYLYEGNHSVSYTATVTHDGRFASGYADAQCLYATEIMAHSSGCRMEVADKGMEIR